jgi:predicted short-subunit dehydrogenase-like oxidoreductase (DUF2520 family)
VIKSVNIIGSGNVATHLGKNLCGQIDVKTVYSHSIINANILAEEVNSIPVNQISDLSIDVDLNIICLKDDIINQIIHKLPKEIPTVHTSGSIGIDVIKSFEKYGILYPLQTFSKHSDLLMSEIPFLIEGNSNAFTNELKTFCENNLSAHTQITDSKTRQQIHLSAVLSNNFITALLRESEIILNQNNLDLSLLNPLLFETLKKSFDSSPKESQTGPAKRLDYKVINSQLQLIESEKIKQIYQLLSELIIEQQNTIL